MTVVVVCPKCSKQLKVTEQQVGKRAKCPNCKEVITLQASAPAAGAASAEKGMWKVMTGENEEFGPVTKAELDAWMADGRLDAQCQVLQDGWEQWKWADEVYPQLAETNSAQTPTLQVATSPTVGLNTGGISLPPLGGPDSLPLPGTGGPKLPTPVGNPSPGPLGLGSPLGGAPLGSSPPPNRPSAGVIRPGKR